MAQGSLFSGRDVGNILGLKKSDAVDRLVRSGVLTIAAYTPRGLPLFTAAAIVRAAKRVLPDPE